MKERYLVKHLARREYDDTSAIGTGPDGPFGATGHDLAAACKRLRVPATVAQIPQLRVRGKNKSVEYAHQVWRYGIDHTGAEDVERWLKRIASWLEETQ